MKEADDWNLSTKRNEIKDENHAFYQFYNNIITGLLAYSFLPKKPSIKVDFIDDKQLMLF